jgi:hypothetical protein
MMLDSAGERVKAGEGSRIEGDALDERAGHRHTGRFADFPAGGANIDCQDFIVY